jgi:hypothetical protein
MKRERCGHCGKRAEVKMYRHVAGPDGLYTEERCCSCGGVLSFVLELAVDCKTAGQLISKGSVDRWSAPVRRLT